MNRELGRVDCRFDEGRSSAHPYPWHASASASFLARGYAWRGGRLLRGAALAEDLAGCADPASLLAALQEADGCFAVVAHFPGEVVAAVDAHRSFPLFWHETPEGRVLVADGPGSFPSEAFVVEEDVLESFRYANYVTSHGTLLRGVFQLCAGDALHVVEGPVPQGVSVVSYWKLAYEQPLLVDRDEALASLAPAYEEMGRRMVEFLDGRRAVVPLSGGHDSRRVLLWLVKAGYRNLLAYSYGRRDGVEARIALSVCERLRVPFCFVEYRNGSMREQLRRWGDDALVHLGGLGGMANMQEFHAVEKLLREGVVDPDCVFLPGHGGNFVGGGSLAHLMRRGPTDPDGMADAILSIVYDNAVVPLPESVRERLKPAIAADPVLALHAAPYSPEQATEIFERYDHKERQSKYMANAVRIYDHLGLPWAVPLYLRPVQAAWSRIDPRYKIHKDLSAAFGRSCYEQETSDIPYATEMPAVGRPHGPVGKAWKAATAYWIGQEYFWGMLPIRQYIRQAMRRRIRVNGYFADRTIAVFRARYGAGAL